MILDFILPNYTDFRRYSTKLVIWDVTSQKGESGRYSQKKVILHVIPEKNDFKRFFTGIRFLQTLVQ